MNSILNRAPAVRNSQSLASSTSPVPGTCNLLALRSPAEEEPARHSPAEEEPARRSPAEECPSHRSRRNGKIARLPKKLRDLVNELLSDGVTYAQIVQRLNESIDPPLPYQVAEKNISNWQDGGYQDWLQHQDRMELLASKLDFALDLARNRQPEKLQELSLQLAAMRLCEFLSEHAIADPKTDPTIYLRLLSALPRISREALNIQKYRDADAQVQAQALAQKLPPGQAITDQDRAEACRTAFLDQMDDIMGLKSYRNLPAAVPPSPPPETLKPQIQDPESPSVDANRHLQTPNPSAEPPLPPSAEALKSQIQDLESPSTNPHVHVLTPNSPPRTLNKNSFPLRRLSGPVALESLA